MLLKQLLEENNLHFEDKFYEDCEVFIKLLQQWGKVHNLSGRLLRSDIEENINEKLRRNHGYKERRTQSGLGRE